MAKKSKRTKEDYPIVKYRVVDGNGYSLCEGENELKEKLKRDFEYYESVKGGYDTERFKPQYVIKVTEEYIEIPYQCAEEKLTEFEKGVHQMVDTAVREGGLTPLQYEICCKNLLERAQRELASQEDGMKAVCYIRKEALLELLKPEHDVARCEDYERGCIDGRNALRKELIDKLNSL